MKRERILQNISLTSILLLLVSCSKVPDCNLPETVHYNSHVADLIEIHCFKCHAQDVYKEKASRVKIFNYETLREMGESGQLMGSVTHKTGYIAMPYKRESKIDSCTIELLKKWVETGMQK
ncbi:hypothetical protein M0D21_17395 [Aquimarina sp. D1M17]|uniref:hypothetical protein n=1 Tax=Aquimarina acroporae TaxID=2937283 RepID=UPI0020BDA2A4|nr:hypothetical protein [Aquimarina acroporae]MCK8523360.1 hypothetical protein [Aquimarina acroporae]